MNPCRPRILIATALATAGLALTACSTKPTAASPTKPTSVQQATATTATDSTAASDSAASETAATTDIPATTTGTGNECSLLTQADVDAAVGQPLGKGKSDAALGTCQWSTSDFVADVDITVSDWAAIKTAATGGSKSPVSVPGVGDEALNLNGSNGSLLYVRKGSQGFLITINGPKIDSLPDHGLAKETILAAAVLDHL